MPKFSIIIPSYNRAKVLPRAIQSIFNQTNKDWELILVDDGSTDDTSTTVLPFTDLPEFKYIYQKNSGVSAARNLGASQSNGEWLIFLDSDDELATSSLENFQSYIQLYPQKILFVAGNERKTSFGSEIRIPKKGYNPFLSGTFCLHREVFEQVGGYDSRFTFSENTELLYRIGQVDVKPFFLATVSLIYHETFIGGSKNPENIIQSVSLFLSKHKDSMSIHHKYLYNQIVGVNQLRFQRFDQARKHLWKAYLLKPWKLATLARLGVGFVPSISRKIYNKQIP